MAKLVVQLDKRYGWNRVWVLLIFDLACPFAPARKWVPSGALGVKVISRCAIIKE